MNRWSKNQSFKGNTIILFTRNVSSHKTDWILSELPLFALSCLLYRRVYSLMNAPEGGCLCLREISVNVNELFTFFLAVLWLPVYLFIRFFILHCCCCPFTSLSLFLYWCCWYIFVSSLCKQVHCFCFADFVYHFNNTVFIFVTI